MLKKQAKTGVLGVLRALDIICQVTFIKHHDLNEISQAGALIDFAPAIRYR